MADDEKEEIRLRNLQHLKVIADKYKHTSPNLSNLCSVKTIDIKRWKPGIPAKPNSSSCPYCGIVYSVDNHNVRLKPRKKMTKKLKQLLNKYAKNPSSLGKYQANLVNSYLYSSNVLIKMCAICKKRNKTPCQSRHERSLQTSLESKSHGTNTKVKTGKERKKEKKKQRRKQKLMDQRSGFISLSDTSLSEVSIVSKDVSALPVAFSTPRSSVSLRKSLISSLTSSDGVSVNSSSVQGTFKSLPGADQSFRKFSAPDSSNTLKLFDHKTSRYAKSQKRDSSDSFKKPNSTKQSALILSMFNNTSEQSQESKSNKKKKCKNKHQLLSKMLAKEKKTNSQAASLSDFLSSL